MSLLRRVRSDRGLAAVAGAAAVGSVLRAAWAIVAARDPQGLFDPARYAGYADGIARGRGMVEPLTGEPTAYFPPGYPWFLGAIDWVLVHTPLPDDLPVVAGLAQALLGGLSVALLGLLGRRLVSPGAGVVAAAGLAVYPNLVLHAGTLLSETLAITLLLGLLVALVPPGPWPEGLAGRRLVAAGVLLGGLLLVRPVSAGVVLAVGVVLLVARVGWRRLATTLGVLLGVAALCVLPWTVRNLVRMDAFVPLSTNTGDNLCIGHGAGATGGFRLGGEECQSGTGVQDGTEGELRNDDVKTERAIDAITSDWHREPWLTWRRFAVTVERDDDAVRAVQSYGVDDWIDPGPERLLTRVSDWSWYLVGVVGLAGLVRLVRDRRPDRLLVPLTALGLLLAPLATFGDARFKLPIVPLLLLAAAALVTPGAAAGRPARPASRWRSSAAGG